MSPFSKAGFLVLIVALALPASAKTPNILFILADDMGYGDMGLTGSRTIKTPNLDALARSGVFCTQGYVPSAVCSPSRAGILTGRDPRRFGYEGNLNDAAENYATRPELLGLPPGELTLGDHLRAAGYRTGLIGKWHLGAGGAFHPNQRGFDHFCGMLNGSHSYFPTAEKNHLERNGKPLTEFSSPYLTSFFTDEALDWTGSGDSDSPWFLFLSYNAPHTPMEATKEDLALYSDIKSGKRRTYAAMMHSLDQNIGRLITHLNDTRQLENTLIAFLSDNGGATTNASWNGRLSGAKGSLREGGVRVPFFLSWPGTLPQGNTYPQPVSALDLLPTFLAAAGADPLPQRQPLSHEDRKNHQRMTETYGAYDGINLLPVLAGRETAPERLLFWRLQGQAAVLKGDHKLIALSHRPAQLFRPATDPGEQSDLSASQAETFRTLFTELGNWQSTLPTVPLWDSSPYWWGDSAQIYDTWAPRSEPE
ncbi:MAG: sulfatase-like hydrolase/transferase [Verrucomicrobiales bacterium]|nr:sulfatase-like hydrolase/transferase [Verrucomicrobiota bacterium JB025]